MRIICISFLCRMGRVLCLLLFLCVTKFAAAQERVTTFGFTYKPIFPSSYFRTGPKEFENKGTQFTITQKSGFNAGALVRRGFTKRLTAETGILYTKRNYKLDISSDSGLTGNSDFKIIGYEIPLNLLVFIQLGQQLWMNAALGASLDLFPSDIFTRANYFRHYSARNHTANTGLNAMTGLEYRTKKSGYFYFGLAYHRSFSSIYNSLVEYYPDGNQLLPPYSIGNTKLQGDYFTFDVRYYFHEDPAKKARTK